MASIPPSGSLASFNQPPQQPLLLRHLELHTADFTSESTPFPFSTVYSSTMHLNQALSLFQSSSSAAATKSCNSNFNSRRLFTVADWRVSSLAWEELVQAAFASKLDLMSIIRSTESLHSELIYPEGIRFMESAS
ncbi:unnamed protein product [Protopolystoma xenopodis]|uniref:Uncharacterized protein n=1 Tax=Protopolystoma xenopodis TaxID=117903 RepID=A0A448WZ89_9PLAT|nr:unnamed protein product [Protopolystoma xenopodis]